MRIVFFGTPDFAVASLRALIQSRFTVGGVVTQPDKPQGRSRSQLVAPPVKVAAQAEGIPVLQPARPVGDVFATSLRRLEPDLGVVVAYGHILRPEILSVPPLRSRFLLQTASAWERIGVGFNLPFAGLHIVEATKQLYRAVTVRPIRRAARLGPVFIPAAPREALRSP